MDKGALRHELNNKLVQMSIDERVKKSKMICEHVIGSEVFRQASVIMVYLSMPHEVETTPLILHAWQAGKTIAVPKVSWEQRHMIPVELKSLETGLKTNDKGLRNPVNGMVPVPFDEIDLVLTPGIGFDRHGNRLGRGGGYYDRFFASKKINATRWALAFSEQLCDAVPHEENDIPVNAVVTEQEIITCSDV